MEQTGEFTHLSPGPFQHEIESFEEGAPARHSQMWGSAYAYLDMSQERTGKRVLTFSRSEGPPIAPNPKLLLNFQPP